MNGKSGKTRHGLLRARSSFIAIGMRWNPDRGANLLLFQKALTG